MEMTNVLLFGTTILAVLAVVCFVLVSISALESHRRRKRERQASAESPGPLPTRRDPPVSPNPAEAFRTMQREGARMFELHWASMTLCRALQVVDAHRGHEHDPERCREFVHGHLDRIRGNRSNDVWLHTDADRHQLIESVIVIVASRELFVAAGVTTADVEAVRTEDSDAD